MSHFPLTPIQLYDQNISHREKGTVYTNSPNTLLPFKLLVELVLDYYVKFRLVKDTSSVTSIEHKTMGTNHDHH